MILTLNLTAKIHLNEKVSVKKMEELNELSQNLTREEWNGIIDQHIVDILEVSMFVECKNPTQSSILQELNLSKFSEN